MKLSFSSYWQDAENNRYLPLTETSPGVYTASWNAVTYDSYHFNPTPCILWSGNHLVTVYDDQGNQSGVSGQITISGVKTLNADPQKFSGAAGQTTTITAEAAEGIDLEATVTRCNSDTGEYAAIKALPMTGTGDSYTAVWDGTDESGDAAAMGDYVVFVRNAGSGIRYAPRTNVEISAGVTEITPSADPFVPTGDNSVTITAKAQPGQTGLKLYFGTTWRDADNNPYRPLTETSPGVYAASWNAVTYDSYHFNPTPCILWSGNHSITVYDDQGNQSEISGQITISGVKTLSADPQKFSGAAGQSTTITAEAAEGINLEATVTRYNSDTGEYAAIKAVPMTGSGGIYTAVWDGTDTAGNVAEMGDYAVFVRHAGSGIRYAPRTNVEISAGVTEIVPSSDPFVPTGDNSVTITANAQPGQTGLKLYFGSNWHDADNNRYLPLMETSSGVYAASWNAVTYDPDFRPTPCILYNGNFSISVYDNEGNQDPTTGLITISGIQNVTTSPSPFTPGGGNVMSITVEGAPGFNIEARIFNNATDVLTRTLPMTEASGTYTCEWEGKDSYGNFAGANNYRVYVYNKDSDIRYSASQYFTVNVAVFAINASPNPFVPTGSNTATITVQADPLQSGLTASITHPTAGTVSGIPLQETGSEGTYTGIWDGKINGAIPGDGACIVRVFSSSGNEFPATASLILSSWIELSITPNPFETGDGRTAVIEARMPPGLDLEARIGTLKTVPLYIESLMFPEIYYGEWDGKNSAGQFASAGNYTVVLWNVETGTRYDIEEVLTVVNEDSYPDTNITSGPAEGSLTGAGNVTFRWTGSSSITGALAFSYKMDDAPWSAFSSQTEKSFTSLSEGEHTFHVKAKDAVGTEDPTPATRTFTVDASPPSAPSGFNVSVTSSNAVFSWSASSSPDVKAYKIYWDNGTGTIDYSTPYAMVHHPETGYTTTIADAGTFRFGLRAIDEAGNEEKNTTVTAQATIAGFGLTVSADSALYDRGQEIGITGAATTEQGAPIADLPVTIDVETKGYHRYFTAYTDSSGQYHYTFNPLFNEAGHYTIGAKAIYDGLQKTVSTEFDIMGLQLKPSAMNLNLSMNSTHTVNVSLTNIGGIRMTGLQYELMDSAPGDLITVSIPALASLPSSLEPGTSVTIALDFSAEEGTPPAGPLSFNLNVSSAEGATETATISVIPHAAVSVPVIEPAPPIKIGVRFEEPANKEITITNNGYAPMGQTTVAVDDPGTFHWIGVINGAMGTIAPMATKTCRIYVNPPEDLTIGSYQVKMNLFYDGAPHPFFLDVEVTTANTGTVEFKVYDDTGETVANAEVNLVAEEYSILQTPDGIEEYQEVIKESTDGDGYVLFQDVPVGKYKYLINAAGHDQSKGEITVEPGTSPQRERVILVTNLVDIEFYVTETTITDEYTVTLNITYVTDLIKPALYVHESPVYVSFFPEEVHEGVLTIKNTSNNAPVKNLTLDASQIDLQYEEVEIFFSNGEKTYTVNNLNAQEEAKIAYKAVYRIDPDDAQMYNRFLGNITATADYKLSIEGEALDQTTTTKIPLLFQKPKELHLPSITFENDLRDGSIGDFDYKGDTYRLEVKSNRDMAFNFEPEIKAVNPQTGNVDPAALIAENEVFWTTQFNRTNPMTFKGDTVTFDIDGLEEALEERALTTLLAVYRKSYLGITGQWADRSEPDTYLVHVYVRVIEEGSITVTGGGGIGGGIGWFGGWHGSTPSPPNEHGRVKLEIEQKVSLERQAFDTKLVMTPTVDSLQNVSVTLNIEDMEGTDANNLFFVILTGNTGITSLEGGTISGPANINWQVVPSSTAGGTTADGEDYHIWADIAYSYGGNTYSYETGVETITVKPMPKLMIDYDIPYVVMADIPVEIRVKITNEGAGTANNVEIASAQPVIVENLNNLPIDFVINGSADTYDDTGYHEGNLTINFGDIPPGGVAEGWWALNSTKDGYFVEFTADLKHESYLGVELDPLIEVSTHFTPAIGGRLYLSDDTGLSGLRVQVRQDGQVKGESVTNETGRYFISDLVAGEYQWILLDYCEGESLISKDIVVLPEQPTAHISQLMDENRTDVDKDGMPDCWEIENFGDLVQNADDDYDHDDLINWEEFKRKTDPTVWDTDGDGFNDGQEILIGSDPLNPNDPSNADSDGDRLCDDWEYKYFGNLDESLHGDPDKDCLCNFDEQKKGSDPTQPPEDWLDSDGDCLPDDWEEQKMAGVSNDQKISIDIDGGPINGQKDIFLWIDHMYKEKNTWTGKVKEVFNAEPPKNVIMALKNVFKLRGFNLHVAYGGRDHRVVYDESVSEREWKNGFSKYKEDITFRQNNFTNDHSHVFRYALFADALWSGEDGQSHIPFIPALDYYPTEGIVITFRGNSDTRLKAILMHEFGHSLGLGHGGPISELGSDQGFGMNNKPNYLSIMNYMYVNNGNGLTIVDSSGKKKGGILDYNVFSQINPLNEESLDETNGLELQDPEDYIPPIGAPNSITPDDYVAFFYAPRDSVELLSSQWWDKVVCSITSSSGPCLVKDPVNRFNSVDWNTDGTDNFMIRMDVNGDANFGNLKVANDWENLILGGWNIGQKEPNPPSEGGASCQSTLLVDRSRIFKFIQESTTSEKPETRHFDNFYFELINYKKDAGKILIEPGQKAAMVLIIANMGMETDTYDMSAASDNDWAIDISPPFEAVPQITLGSGQHETVQFIVHVPETAEVGTEERIYIRAQSQGHSILAEGEYVYLEIADNLEADTDEDNLFDSDETALGLDPNNPDTDGDGIYDGVELIDIDNPEDLDQNGVIDAKDPDNFNLPDTDGDGLSDGRETRLGLNPNNADTDDDGIIDSLEVGTPREDDPAIDFDGDGVIDALEPGSDAYSPPQTDADNDGIIDSADNCPDTPNPDQENADGDSAGDICDGCPFDTNKTTPGTCGCFIPDTDLDNDGIPDCIVYDFNNNGRVDVQDIMLVASRWNTSTGSAGFDPTYDIDGNGTIDVQDIMKVAAQWGWEANL